MSPSDDSEIVDAIKALPAEVINEGYSDLLKNTLVELGKLGVDTVKTVRLLFFPVQYAAMWQDRLAAHIKRALEKVPEEKRISPAPALLLQIGERLRFQDEDDAVADMYEELLARAMDRDKVGEAHPAFIVIIGQLAPDEAVLLRQLAELDTSAYIRHPGKGYAIRQHERDDVIMGAVELKTPFRTELCKMMVRPEELSQPDLLYTYIDHVVSLGLVVYNTTISNARRLNSRALGEYNYHFIEFTPFGRLFHAACLRKTPAAAHPA